MNADCETQSQSRRVRYRYIVTAFIVYVPLMAGGLLWSIRDEAPRMLPLVIPGFVVLGMFGWTLLEYLLHRLVHTGAQANRIGNALSRLHSGHHRNPANEAKITTPAYGTFPIAAVLLGMFRLAGASWEAALFVMTGIIGGYLFYEIVHFRIHCGFTRGRVIKIQQAAHLLHHHQSPSRCFGVTTPLWDWIFRTHPAPLRKMRIS